MARRLIPDKKTRTQTRYRYCRQTQGCPQLSEQYVHHPPQVLQILVQSRSVKQGLLNQLTHVDWLNSNPLFNMRTLRIVGDLMTQYLRFTKGIDESCTTSPRSTYRSTLRSVTRTNKRGQRANLSTYRLPSR